MFDAVTNSKAEPQDMVKAVSQGVNEHRIMAWSSHTEEQKILAGIPIAGILPTTNEDSTTTGVLFRDMSAPKMDFYLETSATLSTDVGTAETPTFTTTVNLRSTLTPELAASCRVMRPAARGASNSPARRHSSTGLPARPLCPRRSQPTSVRNLRPPPMISAGRWHGSR